MTALVLQARLDSTRLSGKSLLPLEDEPLIYRVMEALAAVPCDVHVLACPEDCLVSFSPLAVRAGFEICAGPKDDVLARYCLAIRRFSPDWVIRATGDNPFVFADAAAAITEEAAALKADYSAYAGLPYGAGVEVIRAEALIRAEEKASLSEEREHVCPYLYNHPELFRLHRPLAPCKWQVPQTSQAKASQTNRGYRLTVDTLEDYNHAKKLYQLLSKKNAGSARYRGTTILEAADEAG